MKRNSQWLGLTAIVMLLQAGFVTADAPRTLYVMNGSAETLSKMSLEDNTISQNIFPTGQTPNFICVHNDKLYTVNSGTDDIMVIDPLTDALIQTIAMDEGNNPWAMGFTGLNKAYVTNFNDNSVSVVDLEAGTVVKRIEVGKAPEGILVYKNQAFVANTGYAGFGLPYEQASVSIIDILTDSVTHTVNVPTNAQDLAADPMGRIHVVCTGDYAAETGKVAVIDLFTGPAWDTPAVVDTFDMGGSPGDIAVTASGKGYCVAWGDGTNGHLYAYNAAENTVLNNADNPLLVGPNVSRLLYDGQEDVLWIPTMTVWGGDGFVQKFDVTADSVVWVSNVVGNGTQDVAILEAIETFDRWADAVASFTPGAGAGFGANYYPANVLGAPDMDPVLNEFNASANPREILSLGHGGEIVLQFTDNYIVNGEGVDFTVFENAFISTWTNEPFIEAGIVSVSMDGVNFVEFSYDTATYAGLAGVTPMKDNQHPEDPSVSGGDSFDLADLGMDYALYVKITDLGDIKSEGAWNGDFDLDAVVAVNSAEGQPVSDVADAAALPDGFALNQNYPNPFNPETVIAFSLDSRQHVELTVFNMLGQKVKTLLQGVKGSGRHQVMWHGCDQRGNQVVSGVYFYQLKTGNAKEIRKMTLMR